MKYYLLKARNGQRFVSEHKEAIDEYTEENDDVYEFELTSKDAHPDAIVNLLNMAEPI
jgi:hypothetical protein